MDIRKGWYHVYFGRAMDENSSIWGYQDDQDGAARDWAGMLPDVLAWEGTRWLGGMNTRAHARSTGALHGRLMGNASR